MNTTVRICGVDYPASERVQDGTFWGIKTSGKTFWLFPVCDEKGNEIQSLPPYLPCEIKAVTVEPPNLTQQHPETVKKLFEQRRAYFATATLPEYLKQYPNVCWLTAEQFKTERDRIMAESLKDFERDPILLEMIWFKHGTREIANQFGYLGDIDETVTRPDGTSRRFTTKASVELSLATHLQQQRKLGWDAACAIVGKLKYVMINDGVPAQRFIYLEEMKVAEHPPRQPSAVPELADEAKSKAAKTGKVVLNWPEGKKQLDAIKKSTDTIQSDAASTKADVSKLLGKQVKRQRKWHQDGGKATSKWKAA